MPMVFKYLSIHPYFIFVLLSAYKNGGKMNNKVDFHRYKKESITFLLHLLDCFLNFAHILSVFIITSTYLVRKERNI